MLPVEINQWRAAIGCFRVFMHNLSPVNKNVRPFSLIFKFFKLILVMLHFHYNRCYCITLDINNTVSYTAFRDIFHLQFDGDIVHNTFRFLAFVCPRPSLCEDSTLHNLSSESRLVSWLLFVTSFFILSTPAFALHA